VHENGTLEPIEVILRKENGMRKNDGEHKSNQDTLYAYMDVSQ
jgi:hypothetical protein